MFTLAVRSSKTGTAILCYLNGVNKLSLFHFPWDYAEGFGLFSYFSHIHAFRCYFCCKHIVISLSLFVSD